MLGKLICDRKLSLLGENLCNCDCLPVCGSFIQRYGSVSLFLLPVFLWFPFIFLNLFYLFIFGCVGSSLLRAGFL